MMDITYKRIRDHYEIYVDGQFYCSCDDMTEVDAEIDRIRTAEQLVQDFGNVLEEIIPQILDILKDMAENLDQEQMLKGYLDATNPNNLEDWDYEK